MHTWVLEDKLNEVHVLQAPALFECMGLRPPRGVILHGPPGTGKTMLACAAAADAGARLFVLNGPDIISEFVGESEAGLQVRHGCTWPGSHSTNMSLWKILTKV